RFPVDYDTEEVAKTGGVDIADLRSRKDKGAAMKAFDECAPKLVRLLFEAGKFEGIVGMGGSGGSAIIASAMRALRNGRNQGSRGSQRSPYHYRIDVWQHDRLCEHLFEDFE